MKNQQFALDMSGLTQLRDQFQRCWQFVKQHSSAARKAPSTAAPAAGTAPNTKPDQFVAAATKNAIRVEDLKPPPPKHRRTGSALGTSPANTGSPMTPSTNLTSPAPTTGSPATANGTKAKPPPKGRNAARKDTGPTSSPAPGLPGASPAATLQALRTDLIRDSPSPRGIVVPPAASVAAMPVIEEAPSLKRKREEDEIQKNPDAYIEKALSTLEPGGFSFDDFLLPGVVDGSAPNSAPGSASGLALDFEPALPPVVLDASSQPLSFVSSAPNGGPSMSYAEPVTNSNAPQDALDFDFLIDSSAAGFAEPDAPTPDLVGGGGGEGSTASAQTPATPADATATPKNPPTSLVRSPKKQSDMSSPPKQTASDLGANDARSLEDAFFSANGLVVEDIDRWLAGGQDPQTASDLHDGKDLHHHLDPKHHAVPSFSWEGEPTLAHDSWNFYPEF